jgi:hypothetical protein
VFAAVAILIIAIIAAHGSPSCMTQAEARRAFPKSHLWWHGLDHCWDNKHGHRKTRPSREPDGIADRPTIAAVHFYPRAFDQVDAIEPPIIVSLVEYRWPGSNVIFDMDQIMEASR